MTAAHQQPRSASQPTARRESKKAHIIAMLHVPGGVTIQAMARAANWQPHSVRGFLAGVVRRKLGLNLISAAGESGRVYRITDRTATSMRLSAMRRTRSIAPKATRLSLDDEIAHLRDLDLHGLRARWKSMFRQQPPAHLPRHLLFAVLAYRLQADELGDLDPATARLLRQIATGGGTLEASRLTDGSVAEGLNSNPARS